MELQNIDRIPQEYHADIQEFIQLCLKKLKEDLVSIILFGSIARGAATEWSDFDFCVVVRRLNEKVRFELLQEFRKNCDVVFRREEDFSKYIGNLNALDLEIFDKGFVIYGKDVLAEQGTEFERVKEQFNLLSREELGKGVWEIGVAS